MNKYFIKDGNLLSKKELQELKKDWETYADFLALAHKERKQVLKDIKKYMKINSKIYDKKLVDLDIGIDYYKELLKETKQIKNKLKEIEKLLNKYY